jgi:hypothetical protein
MHLTGSREPVPRPDWPESSKEAGMFGISDAHHFRKMVAGFCMVFAPLFVLVGFVIDPDASYTFLFIGTVLSVPAALGLMHMLREREVAFGHAGGAFALVGLAGMAALVGMDVGGSTDLVDRVDHLSGVTTMMFIAALLWGAGCVVLGMGLYRAHATASWTAACLIIGGIALDVALVTANGSIAIAGSALMLAGEGVIGLNVWRESDEAWEHTPALTAR